MSLRQGGSISAARTVQHLSRLWLGPTDACRSSVPKLKPTSLGILASGHIAARRLGTHAR
jgi:hypothetical protein